MGNFSTAERDPGFSDRFFPQQKETWDFPTGFFDSRKRPGIFRQVFPTAERDLGFSDRFFRQQKETWDFPTGFSHSRKSGLEAYDFRPLCMNILSKNSV